MHYFRKKSPSHKEQKYKLRKSILSGRGEWHDKPQLEKIQQKYASGKGYYTKQEIIKLRKKYTKPYIKPMPKYYNYYFGRGKNYSPRRIKNLQKKAKQDIIQEQRPLPHIKKIS